MRTGACCGICTHLEAFKVVTGLFEDVDGVTD
jgi:hypothetical protein